MASRPEFREGDVVMVCRHIYEAATRGELLNWTRLKYKGRFEPPCRFNRNDGTSGQLDFAVACVPCSKLPSGEVDYIEERYRDGHLHVADFCMEVHGWPT
jgi:hypothetical protein